MKRIFIETSLDIHVVEKCIKLLIKRAPRGEDQFKTKT